MRTLNFGVLAHVDAGKTTLTERLLHAAGVIDVVGSVDAGTTTTDTLPLERQRGITIRAAVVSFTVGDVVVNLIDTPGHPDFIAEVERSLSVLDGAVLVISAVEGVQSQTLVLMRALQRLGVATLLFINKIDRQGADLDRTLAGVRARLSDAIVPLTSCSSEGSASAVVTPVDLSEPATRDGALEVLSRHDDRLVEAYVDERELGPDALLAALAAQVRAGLAYPVLAGSALTGAGVDAVLDAIVRFLPSDDAAVDCTPAGTVFAVDRTEGARRALVRLFAGGLRVRDRLEVGGAQRQVTSIEVYEDGTAVGCGEVGAGRIARIGGFDGVQIGDTFGDVPRAPPHPFSAPALETVLEPVDRIDGGRLHGALSALADQDPLINLRVTDTGALTVSLYGEVQKEVIAATIFADLGIEVRFSETTPICIERPLRTGAAYEQMRRSGHPFLVTLGYEIKPTEPGSGVSLSFDVAIDGIPIHVFKTVDAFYDAVEAAVHATLSEGLHGWQVTDCHVTLTDAGFVAATIAADYRKATPLVLMRALRQARTAVCEPLRMIRVEAPSDTLGVVLGAAAEHRGELADPQLLERTCVITARLPATELHLFQQRVPELTRGEGHLESEPDGYRPVAGHPPQRPRSTPDPLRRDIYLRTVTR